MATISIQFKSGLFYLEDQALADTNFVWDDYTFLPPVILPDGRKLFVHRDLDVQYETFVSTSSDPAFADPESITELLETVVLPQLTHENGSSSGEITVNDVESEVILKCLNGLGSEIVTATVIV